MSLFRVQAIKPTVLRTRALRRVIENAQRRAGTKDRRLLAQTTKHWSTQPKWVTDISFSGGDAAIITYIKDPEARQIWDWINKGTEAHWIYPRRANYLRFNGSFRSQSRPNTLATAPGSSGPPVRYSKGVRHPGIKSRNWTILATKTRYKDYKEEMNDAVEEGLKAGGWN